MSDEPLRGLGENDLEKLGPELRQACQAVAGSKKSWGTPIHVNPPACRPVARDGLLLPGHDDSGERALRNARTVLEYYQARHGRDGIDGKHGRVTAVVHVGRGYDNAYWDTEGSFMAYGDGDPEGSRTKDYTLALDIVGHEMTHGVIAATAKLDGEDEPGALNESFADIFGILISRSVNRFDGWTIGRNLYDQNDPDNELGLRSLSDPHKFDTDSVRYPAKMSEKLAVGEKCTERNDQCEVHANSLIPSHAAYLVAKAIGDEEMGQLYYIALTQRVGPRDDFHQVAHDIHDVCGRIYPRKKCDAVRRAFVQTELMSPDGSVPHPI
jgi:bacillolysin